MTSNNKSSNLKTISPEMRERSRIMSRMTPEEKRAYRWKCYDDKAKPKFLELINHCQKDNRIAPNAKKWGLIGGRYMKMTRRNEFTVWPPYQIPLILGGASAPDNEKRLRLLTQIYWCYKNTFIDYIYEDIMKLSDDDWVKGVYQEDEIPLELIQKEYASWLGLSFHPEPCIWDYCTNFDKKQKQVEKAEEIYNKRNHILDDESNTSIDSR